MSQVTIRQYNPETDYEGVKKLYQDSKTFGGQFDEARDSELKLQKLSELNPNKILIAQISDILVGTVTLFEDGRAAWLYRFAVQEEYESDITKALYDHGATILKQLGHSQILVYSPTGDSHLEQRYLDLGLKKGNTYTAYRNNI